MPTRRSARVHQHDPILYPGFGTAKDIQRLAADLSSESQRLPVEAVEVIMKSRGRGLNVSEDTPTAPVISNAWANFMQEEGVNNGTSNTTTQSPEGGGGGETSEPKDDNNNNSSNKKVSASVETSRVYEDKLLSTKKKSKQTAGVLIQTGTLDVTIVGRSKINDTAAYHLVIPTCLSLPRKITSVFTSCSAVHSIALAEDGTCYGWGRNESHQLTAQLPQNVYYPTEMPCPPVQSAATGKSHTILLYTDGTLWATGSNKSGQCGIKGKVESVPNLKSMAFDGGDVQQITAGEDFTVVLSTDGVIYTTGSSEYGQLGNGETGEYFVTASKLAFANCQVLTPQTTFCHSPGEKLHTNSSEQKVVPMNETIKIGSIAAGKHHTLAVEAASNQPSRVFSWGCGHYGVLGHGRVADEYYPRLIGVLPHLLAGVNKEPPIVAAGAHCSLLQNNGHVYYWGQHRNNAEAVLRPQLVDVLAHNGHVVTQMSAGGQTVFCSTSTGQTVAWGQGPHGELGLERAKSSAKPTFVTKLDGCIVQSLACGYGHSLFVVDSAIAKDLDTIDSDAVEELNNRKEKEPVVKKKKVTRK